MNNYQRRRYAKALMFMGFFVLRALIFVSVIVGVNIVVVALSDKLQPLPLNTIYGMYALCTVLGAAIGGYAGYNE